MKSMHAQCTDPADDSTYVKTGVITGYDGNLSIDSWLFRSNAVHQIIPVGSGYRVLMDCWNPGASTGPPTDTEEGWFTVLASDPVTFDAAPAHLAITLGSSWYANSAENPSVVRR